MYRIGIIGDKDSIMGFKALGFEIFPVNETEETEQIIKKLAQDDFAVIYITEQVASTVMEVIDEYRESQFPAIIPIPGNQGVLGIGMQGVKDAVEKAIGADILFKND